MHPDTMNKIDPDAADEFVPRGAVAFFAGLIAFYALVWLGLYALMAGRS